MSRSRSGTVGKLSQHAAPSRSEELWRVGGATWPTVSPDRAVFERLVKRQLEQRSLAEIDAAECYIAAACLAGTGRALRAFETMYFASIEPVVRSLGGSWDETQEVRQGVREVLFVAKRGEEPKIGEVAGAGSLAGFVRVVAWRQARRIRARRRSEVGNVPERADGTERAAQRSLDVEQFRSAFSVALDQSSGALTDREMTLLHLHYVQGVPPDRIGRAYGVHRTTAWRWINRARDHLAGQLKGRLRDQLKATDRTIESLLSSLEGNIALPTGTFLAPVAGR